MRALLLRSVIGFTFALALTAFCTTMFAETRQSAPAYQVIVHPENPVIAVDRKFLEDAFLKKIASWPQGIVIRPVDLVPNSQVRRQFTEDVLKRSVEAVRIYWQQRIFSGRDVPPPELDTDEEVVKYVLKYEGAVGYVSGSATLNGSRVLTVR
jgi:ABC-type phosphate transport system substrate-binding protein